MRLSHVFAWQNAGVAHVGERIWFVTFRTTIRRHFEGESSPALRQNPVSKDTPLERSPRPVSFRTPNQTKTWPSYHLVLWKLWLTRTPARGTSSS